ncbi:putative purine nucleoside permease [Daldinia loculata]|uniref:putative purine nucleoside permease n=1 Tax=Daldinia loculata TaxID=103429 RepID=UPI0020C2B4D4|nr:putative purine nucleoside permease [Daldinia loculata]KAI1643319.1 putative purine nucleoside permease [Daldinia loculata]
MFNIMLLLNLVLIALLGEARSMARNVHASTRASDCVNNATLTKNLGDCGKITPKVVIISMFTPEAEIWYTNSPNSSLGNLLAHNISVPGLSPLFPYVHCNALGEVCQLTMGEAEINAATSATAFLFSSLFDLSKTYFLMAGIAGISPKLGTLGSVALSKFSVQVALQYEFDAREMPANFSTGYLSYGAYAPDEYPSIFYGTEVMEVNENLRDAAAELARGAQLVDSAESAKYRALYGASGEVYAAATGGPSVIKCDSATSDVYYSGTMLSEAFENTTKLWTNQSSITYCVSAQEDTAVLNALMRAAVWGLVDFSRVILMRTGSDFDRPPPSVSAFQHLRLLDQNGFDIAVKNIYLAGVEIVKGIIAGWNSSYDAGIKATNYIGDILGTLGGEPDFGLGSVFGGVGFSTGSSTEIGLSKRAVSTERKGRKVGGRVEIKRRT